jgi:putative addiction module CopG family antidote
MVPQLPADLQKLVDEQLATGAYSSAEEVLRDALEALRWRRAEIAAIAEGIADMEAGRYRSLKEIDADLRRKYDFLRDA